MKEYRVQSVTPAGELIKEQTIAARSPEEAGMQLVGAQLFRGQKGFRGTLRAKVYAPTSGGELPTLIRLYQRTD